MKKYKKGGFKDTLIKDIIQERLPKVKEVSKISEVSEVKDVKEVKEVSKISEVIDENIEDEKKIL